MELAVIVGIPAGAEDYHVFACPDGDIGERPLRRLCGIVAQIIAEKGYVGRGRIIDLDPVAALAKAVGDAERVLQQCFVYADRIAGVHCFPLDGFKEVFGIGIAGGRLHCIADAVGNTDRGDIIRHVYIKSQLTLQIAVGVEKISRILRGIEFKIGAEAKYAAAVVLQYAAACILLTHQEHNGISARLQAAFGETPLSFLFGVVAEIEVLKLYLLVSGIADLNKVVGSAFDLADVKTVADGRAAKRLLNAVVDVFVVVCLAGRRVGGKAELTV